MLIYAQIEDAIIAAIKAASESDALGYRLASVTSYGGEFDDESFWTAVRKLPAVWVTVGGSKPVRRFGRKWELGLTIAVMVGTRNVRGERQTRHGAVNEPGSYQLLQDARNLLAGQTLGLPIEALSIGADRTLFNTKNGNEARSVLACEFGTRFTFTTPENTGSLQELNEIGLHYYLKPGDDNEDASDTVTLAA